MASCMALVCMFVCMLVCMVYMVARVVGVVGTRVGAGERVVALCGMG